MNDFTHHHRCHEGGGQTRVQAGVGLLEDVGQVEEDRVDARELLEEVQGHGDAGGQHIQAFGEEVFQRDAPHLVLALKTILETSKIVLDVVVATTEEPE